MNTLEQAFLIWIKGWAMVAHGSSEMGIRVLRVQCTKVQYICLKITSLLPMEFGRDFTEAEDSLLFTGQT